MADPWFVRADSGKIHVIDDQHPKAACGNMGKVSDPTPLGQVVTPDHPWEICYSCKWTAVAGVFTSSPKIVYVCTECKNEVDNGWGHQHYEIRRPDRG